MVANTQIKLRITNKALRRDFTTGRHAPVEAIICVLPSHAEGAGKEALDEMVTNHEAGWAQYGATGTYHITDVDAAVEFIEEHGGNVPFNFK